MQKLAPNFPGIYNDLATVYCDRGDLNEAKRNMEIAIKLDSHYFDYQWNLAILLEKMEEYDKAVLTYKKAISINPDDYRPYRALGVYYNSISVYNEAIKYFNEAIKLSPEDQLAYYGLAYAQLKIGKVNEGFPNIIKAVQLNPTSVDFLCVLGEYYSKIGEYNKAIENYEKAIKVAKKDEEFSKIYLTYGITKRSMNQIDSSIQYLKKSLSLNSKYVGSYIELSNSYLTKKMFNESIELHEKASLEFSSNIDLAIIYNSWGYSLALSGDILGAVEKFEESLQFEPNYEGAKRNLEGIQKFVNKH
jgi:tetratricopeptide (TPR) repeat protein